MHHRTRRKPPSYRLHKASGQAVVTIAGRTFYLGKHGSPRSHQEYARLIAAWERRGYVAPASKSEAGFTTGELIVAYATHAKRAYERSKTYATTIRPALRRFRSVAGDVLANELRPTHLKALQQLGIDEGLSRGYINGKLIRWTRACVKWGVGEELVGADVLTALEAVPPLKAGRTEARESDPVRPIADETVEATLKHLSPIIADMVRLQRLTGMRPGEVCAMTTGEIDTTGDVWWYRPRRHKTAHHGKPRDIPIGPKAQGILARYLRTELEQHLFSPQDVIRGRKQALRANRKTPLTPSQIRRDAKRKARANKGGRPPGERYTSTSYGRAIADACARAFPHPTIDKLPAKDRTPAQISELKRWRAEHRWSPNQLRHSKGTELRRKYGIDAAGAVLGHAKLETTQVYAERDARMAERVARETG